MTEKLSENLYKKEKKVLDKLAQMQYDNQARERVRYARRRVNAMNREIAEREFR